MWRRDRAALLHITKIHTIMNLGNVINSLPLLNKERLGEVAVRLTKSLIQGLFYFATLSKNKH